MDHTYIQLVDFVYMVCLRRVHCCSFVPDISSSRFCPDYFSTTTSMSELGSTIEDITIPPELGGEQVNLKVVVVKVPKDYYAVVWGVSC